MGGREHPSLCETREEEENAPDALEKGLRCLNDSCFLEKREELATKGVLEEELHQ